MSKYKIELHEKLNTVYQILNGKESQRHAADRLGVKLPSIQQWISLYKSDGAEAFKRKGYKRYSKERKDLGK